MWKTEESSHGYDENVSCPFLLDGSFRNQDWVGYFRRYRIALRNAILASFSFLLSADFGYSRTRFHAEPSPDSKPISRVSNRAATRFERPRRYRGMLSALHDFTTRNPSTATRLSKRGSHVRPHSRRIAETISEIERMLRRSRSRFHGNRIDESESIRIASSEASKPPNEMLEHVRCLII